MAFLTRAELLASYAPNSTEDITAVTHQNMVESMMVYGALKSDGYTALDVRAVERLEFDASPYAYGMTPAAVGGLPHGGTYNSFGAFQPGHYVMQLNIDAELQANTYTFYLYGDADAQIGSGFEWNAKDAGERVALSFMIPAEVAGDVADLSVRVSANKNSDTVFHSISWLMQRLGSD